MANVAIAQINTWTTTPYKADDPGHDEWTAVTTSDYSASLPSAFEQSINFFEKNKADLERGFYGKYVAIWRDTILDTDTNFSSLAGRVYQQYGYLPIYMPLVGQKPELKLRSPKLVQ